MLYEQDELRGFYEPGFLHLRVNTDQDLVDLNNLLSEDREAFATFFHEYIHFLQEVTTTSGVMNGHFFIDLLKDIIARIRSSEDADFHVPVVIDNSFNTKANQKLRKVYAGESKGTRYIRYDSYLVETEQVTERNGQVIAVKKFRVYFYDLQNRELKYAYFGHTCLKEYITHTLQKQMLPDIEHDDFPYAIAEHVMQREYPAFGDNNLNLVAYCDACLMFSHPAQLFFELIREMQAQAFVPQQPSDVYRFVYNANIRFVGPMGEFDFSTLHAETVGLAIAQFADALKSDIFEKNREWLINTFLQGLMLRIERPEFITELVDNAGQLTPFFFMVVRTIGTPFFTNNKWMGRFIPPEGTTNKPDQPYQLLVFKQLLALFHGHRQCGLYQFCKTRPDKDITNERCLQAPWDRATEEELCPFGQFWKTWGLIGRTPKWQ